MNNVTPIKPLYVICWRSKITGHEGRGNPASLDLANAWKKEAELRCSTLTHWIMPHEQQAAR